LAQPKQPAIPGKIAAIVTGPNFSAQLVLIEAL
jgi:hypothetical protein